MALDAEKRARAFFEHAARLTEAAEHIVLLERALERRAMPVPEDA